MFIELIFLLFNSSYAKEQKPVFRSAIVSTLTEPLLMTDDSNAIYGIVKDYSDAIAKELKVEFKSEMLPRIRIDRVQDEKFDLNCYTSYSWNHNKELFYWSKVLFYKREILVGLTALPPTLNDFSGQTVGTIHGYVYPVLQKLIDEKKIRREDAADENTNMTKLLNGRVQFITTDEILFQYFKKKNPVWGNKFAKNYLVEETFPIQCALYKESKLTLTKLNSAIDAIVASGKLKAIFNKYK